MDNKDIIAEKHRAYSKTLSGKESIRRTAHRRDRSLGFDPINTLPADADYHAHHIHINNNADVIYIPAELHRSIVHNSLTGKNMSEINAAAVKWALISGLLDTFSYQQLNKFMRAFNLV